MWYPRPRSLDFVRKLTPLGMTGQQYCPDRQTHRFIVVTTQGDDGWLLRFQFIGLPGEEEVVLLLGPVVGVTAGEALEA